MNVVGGGWEAVQSNGGERLKRSIAIWRRWSDKEVLNVVKINLEHTETLSGRWRLTEQEANERWRVPLHGGCLKHIISFPEKYMALFHRSCI